MPLSIETEIEELIQRAKNRLPGERVTRWLADVACEAIDVALVAIAAIDEKDKAADLKRLESQLSAGVMRLVQLVSLPWYVTKLLGVATLGMDKFVAKLGEYSGRAEAFKQEWALPFFESMEDLGHRGRVKLGE